MKVFKKCRRNKSKTFKIFSITYRNRRKRFGLRMNVIAGIINRELEFYSKMNPKIVHIVSQKHHTFSKFHVIPFMAN